MVVFHASAGVADDSADDGAEDAANDDACAWCFRKKSSFCFQDG